MENNNYISIPENEYKELIKSFEKSKKINTHLLELLDLEDNIIIFENKNNLWSMINDRFNNKYTTKPIIHIKQEEFLTEVDKKMEHVKKAQLGYRKKYGNIPSWIVSFFNKNKKDEI